METDVLILELGGTAAHSKKWLVLQTFDLYWKPAQWAAIFCSQRPIIETLLAAHLRAKLPVLNLQDASVLQSGRITLRRTLLECSLVSWHSLTGGWRRGRSLLGSGGPSVRSRQGSAANSGRGHSQESRGCVQKQFDSRARNKGMSKLVDT